MVKKIINYIKRYFDDEYQQLLKLSTFPRYTKGSFSHNGVSLVFPDAASFVFMYKEIYKKVIYLLRDGREAMISYYHMVKNMGVDITLQDLYSGKISIHGGMWHEHVNEWEKNPYKADILFVKYEDLIMDKMKVLEQLCNFLKINRSIEELEKVIEYTSFNFMKNLEKSEDWTRMKKEVNFNKGSFVRKGAINSFKEEVTEDLLKTFVQNSKNNFYDFQ